MSASVGVVLLAGGYGTRLYPLTKERPKALLPLRGGVILDWIWEAISRVPGRSKAVLVTNHRFARQFQAWITRRGVAVEPVDDGTEAPEARLGAVRDLLLGLERLEAGDDVLVLGTDNLFTWSLREFVEFGQAHRPAVSMVTHRVGSMEEARRCAVVELDGSRVVRFVEKPSKPSSLTVGLCIYYVPAPQRHVIGAFLSNGGTGDAPGHLIEWLVPRESVCGWSAGGEWFDVGSTDAYESVRRAWKQRRA